MSIGIEKDVVNEIDPQEKAVLIKAGALIYPLTGRTIIDHVRAGRPIQYSDSETCSKIVNSPLQAIEVAIFPDPTEFLVPGTEGKSFVDQQALVREDSDVFLRRGLGLEGVELIFGEAADFVELTFQHFDRGLLDGKDWRLFGKNYDYLCSRTQTPIGESGYFAVVGQYLVVNGLYVGGFGVDGIQHVGVLRLVVPKRNHV